MTTLEARLNSLNFAKQLEEVKLLLDTAQPKVTFWGTRVVEVKGNSGSVSLDSIASRILKAGNLRCEADDLTPEERIAGVEIVKKVNQFYAISDTQIQKSNWFTRLLNWIREFTFVPYTTRFYIEETGANNFLGFSKEKFIQHFGGSLDDMDRHPASNGSFGPPCRIVAMEDQMRALAEARRGWNDCRPPRER